MAELNKKKFYVVWQGRMPGIYNSWVECKRQITGVPNAQYKSFKSADEARMAFSSGTIVQTKTTAPDYPTHEAIVVDGACNVPKQIAEYQGVLLSSKERIFHYGPFKNGSNNIAEFLALVHALSLCKKNGRDYPIYSDSLTALAWVRKKKANTTIQFGSDKDTLEIIKRAENWLCNNTFNNPLLKWETNYWGENPADFLRK